jgi:hypothetical protein
MTGVEGSVEYIVDYLNQKETEGIRFDGFITFSQGGVIAMRLFQCLQYFSKQLNIKAHLPYFIIFFSGIYTYKMQTYNFLGGYMTREHNLYSGYNTLGLDLETIHIHASNDDLFPGFTEFRISPRPECNIHK